MSMPLCHLLVASLALLAPGEPAIQPTVGEPVALDPESYMTPPGLVLASISVDLTLPKAAPPVPGKSQPSPYVKVVVDTSADGEDWSPVAAHNVTVAGHAHVVLPLPYLLRYVRARVEVHGAGVSYQAKVALQSGAPLVPMAWPEGEEGPAEEGGQDPAPGAPASAEQASPTERA